MSDNGRIITAREATVHTVSVGVRTLSISKKQVTMGVFRQLINEDVINVDTGELVGVPWGTVNYFWGECRPDHLHVVWQKGDQLRRACTHHRWPSESGYHMAIREAETVMYQVLDWYLLRQVLERELQHPDGYLAEDERLVLKVGTWTFRRDRGFLIDALASFLKWDPVAAAKPREVYRMSESGRGPETKAEVSARVLQERKHYHDWMKRSWATLEQKLQKEEAFVPEPPEDRLVVAAELWSEVSHRRDRLRAAYSRQYAALAALDQLFIAV